jgi:L-threonylcarbamoyladenylate synthase
MAIINAKILTQAKERLDLGGVVGVPTETVYGLAARIDRPEGLKKIFQIKGRPLFDPLIVHVESLKRAKSLAKDWPPIADFLGRTFWPGPLTMVVEKSDSVDPLITAGSSTVAIRYPSHPIMLDMIRICDSALAAPSANRFGKTSPSRVEHVREEFAAEKLLVIDGGPCEIGIESTVISFEFEADGFARVWVLRPGSISIEQLRTSLEKWGQPSAVGTRSDRKSPGNLEHHYQPEIPLVVLPMRDPWLSDQARLKIEEVLKKKNLRMCKIELASDPMLAARELYHKLREGSKAEADILVLKLPVKEISGVWQAIDDRLRRAASFYFP